MVKGKGLVTLVSERGRPGRCWARGALAAEGWGVFLALSLEQHLNFLIPNRSHPARQPTDCQFFARIIRVGAVDQL